MAGNGSELIISNRRVSRLGAATAAKWACSPGGSDAWLELVGQHPPLGGSPTRVLHLARYKYPASDRIIRRVSVVQDV